MIHPWIFGGSLLAGGGLMAFALNSQPPDPTRLPSLEPSPTRVRVLPPEPISVVEEPAPAMEMTEIRVTAPVRRVIVKAVAPVPEPEPAPLRPCSDWRELGPTHVAKGSASDIVSVRELCL